MSSLHCGRKGKWNFFLVACAIFGVFSVAYIPCREIYFPDGRSIPLLTDGILLAPEARWQDWFIRGYSHFWDIYPDWPAQTPEASATDFARPAFQFLLYLAHFLLGTHWGSYQFINSFAVAGMGAIAFHIAQTTL